MKLTPINQDDGSWNVADETGKTVKRGFFDKAEAIGWICGTSHELNETTGGPVQQGPTDDAG